MIPVLRCVVENSVLGNSAFVIGASDDVFKGFAFPLCAGNQFVAIDYIGVVVQVVMKLESFLGHAVGG